VIKVQDNSLTLNNVLNILIWIAFLCHHIHELQTFKYRPVFTALHLMQTRYCDEISVRPSVRPSVRLSVTRVNCDKTVQKSVQIYIPYEETFIPVF